ncbi:glycosyltransferase family 2 protein [uncultured Marixanthomonas sp.]|uniref:glycosyltransferase family 2 protein n=1 Tax=uncultured Marixanthomonas sp. TaxID=757245 RepID=UPI0030D6F00A|tara:strand:- start:137392 stop:138108 length:717 start_codon:yes stop_codon:yes gene_type:complete
MKTLSIIIPVYNEEKTIILLLDKIKRVKLLCNITKDIIIIDDGSSDNTNNTLKSYIDNNQNLNIRLISHEVNKGKGAAIHSGIRLAIGEYSIIQDADLEYDPEEYNILLNPIIKGVADVVYGSRFKGSNPHRILFFWHSIGNKVLTFMSNIFTNLNLSDMESCYKIFDTLLLQNINLKEERFGFEPEVTAKISRVPNVRIYEVGISYYGRTYAEGKKINWKDGVRAIYCVIKYGLLKL